MTKDEACYGFFKIKINEKLPLMYADESYYELHGQVQDVAVSSNAESAKPATIAESAACSEKTESTASSGMSTVEYIHPDDVDRVMNTLEMCIANRTETFTYRFRVITQDGHVRHIVRGCRLSNEESSYYIIGMDCNEINQTGTLKNDDIQNYEIDSLTGTLTREAFISRINRLFSRDRSAEHSFIMVDLDGFKAVNDTFGHSIGDKTLIDMADALRSVLRSDDLVGRLGGDEFIICLANIQYEAITEKKACQICNTLRKNLGANVIISGSLGIASYPRDGETFEELYKKADAALYRAKENGKDNYVFYSGTMDDRAVPTDTESVEMEVAKSQRRTRMLIVNNKITERVAIESMFKEEYLVLKSFNGKNALSLMRCYRSGIGIVVLDADLPDMDGYSVIKTMREEKDLASIPVIMISEGHDPEIELRAIAAGAADFVRKPVDENLLRIRVQNAVNRSENERLRIQNSYLLLQEDEEERYRQVLQATGTVVFTHDWVHGVYTYDPMANKYMKGCFDKRPLWRIFLSDMVAKAMDVKAMNQLVMSVAGDRTCDSAEMHVQLKNIEEEWRWFRMQVIKMSDALSLTNKLILTFNDITEQVEAEKVLRNRAECDSLTGLYNRETFFEKATDMVRFETSRQMVLSCFDVENFKTVNEQYGQTEGDRLLMVIGRFLKKKMDKGGIVCSRLTADSFACIQSIESEEDCDDFYDGLTKEVKHRYPMQDIVVCEGRYLVDDRKLRVSTMYDRAFYAKKQIKGRYDIHTATYDDRMQKKVLLKHDITGMMKRALEEHQIEVYYQPQYNHITGEMSGAEALVRWNHPQRGLMQPAEFIPVFEKNGFIYQMDEYVWDCACSTMRRWMDANMNPPHISVNVSRYDIFQKDFFEKITGVITKYSIPPSCLRLEITESAFSNKPDTLINAVRKLKDYGFTVEIDDFGSGYSSLNTLKDVPTDVIKLDMKFLSGEDNLGRGDDILAHIIRMAMSIGLSVIAEGVETKEQAERLLQYNCVVMQGFMYAKPMPQMQFENLLRNGGCYGTRGGEEQRI